MLLDGGENLIVPEASLTNRRIISALLRSIRAMTGSRAALDCGRSLKRRQGIRKIAVCEDDEAERTVTMPFVLEGPV